MTKNKLIAALCLAVGALLAVIVWRAPCPSPPDTALLTTALSNNAASYFTAGAVVGATVERAKPGLAPQQLVNTARAHYATLGPDPFLTVAPDPAVANARLASQNLARLKPQRTTTTHTNMVETNAAPVTTTNATPPTTNAPTSPP